MMWLAIQTLRWRWPSVLGAFLALTCAMAIVGTIGILGETGVRASSGPVERYRAVPIVVTASQTLTVGEDDDRESLRLPVHAGVPIETAEFIRAVPGVAGVVVDVVVPAIVTSTAGEPLALEDGAPPLVTGWSSSTLTPFALRAGDVPSDGSGVVLDARIADADELAVGDGVVVAFAGETRQMTVVGLAEPPAGYQGRPTVFIPDALAVAMAELPGQANAIGVMVEDGADTADVADAIRDQAGSDFRVHTGSGRASAERPELAAQNADLVDLSAAVGSLTVVLAVIMIASILGLVVSQRLREVALLRTIGATPRQVRRLLLGETLIVAVLAGLVGIAPTIVLARYLFGELQARGVGGAYTSLHVGPLPLAGGFAVTLVTASVAAWFASRRATKVRPTVALAEVRAARRRPGWFRLLLGLGALAGMIVVARIAFAQSGIAAVDASAGILIAGLLAAGFLAQAVTALATRVAGGVIGRLAPGTGLVAMAHARAQSRRMTTVVTLLAVTLGLTVTLIGTVTVPMHATAQQTHERIIADRIVSGVQGVPSTVDQRLSTIEGVRGVTRVAGTSVALSYSDLDATSVDFFPAAVLTSNDLPATLELDVRDGSLADFGRDHVVISEDLAHMTGAAVGERLSIWLADGTPATVQVAAIYAQPWGLGDMLLSHEMAAGHSGSRLDGYLLVAFDDGAAVEEVERALRAVAHRLPGLEVVDPADWEATLSEAQEANAWVNYMILAVLGTFCAIAVANSLVLATNDRANDFALLRMTGATRAQVLRIVRWEAGLAVAIGLALGLGVTALTLVPFSQGIAGTSWPTLPWIPVTAIVGAAIALGMLGAELPARRILGRGPRA